MSDLEYMGNRCVYNGECFDSLTEARWAAYFDRVGMPYEYERESFEMPTASRQIGDITIPARTTLYTPDFFLPEQDTYVEIKRGNADDGTVYKLAKLAVRSAKAGVLIDGRPGSFALYGFSPTYEGPKHKSDYNGFTSDYFFNHHMLMPSKRHSPELFEHIAKINGEIMGMGFTSPTDTQLRAKFERRQAVRSNPTVLEEPPREVTV